MYSTLYATATLLLALLVLIVTTLGILFLGSLGWMIVGFV